MFGEVGNGERASGTGGCGQTISAAIYYVSVANVMFFATQWVRDKVLQGVWVRRELRSDLV